MQRKSFCWCGFLCQLWTWTRGSITLLKKPVDWWQNVIMKIWWRGSHSPKASMLYKLMENKRCSFACYILHNEIVKYLVTWGLTARILYILLHLNKVVLILHHCWGWQTESKLLKELGLTPACMSSGCSQQWASWSGTERFIRAEGKWKPEKSLVLMEISGKTSRSIVQMILTRPS